MKLAFLAIALGLLSVEAGCGDDDSSSSSGGTSGTAGSSGTASGGTGSQAGGAGTSQAGTPSAGTSSGGTSSGGTSGGGTSSGGTSSGGASSGGASSGGASSGGTGSEACQKYCACHEANCSATAIPGGKSCADFCANMTKDQLDCRQNMCGLVPAQPNNDHCTHSVGIGQCL